MQRGLLSLTQRYSKSSAPSAGEEESSRCGESEARGIWKCLALQHHCFFFCFFLSQLERGRKQREEENTRSMIALLESDLRVQQGETHALAVKAAGLGECSLSVGAAQASSV